MDKRLEDEIRGALVDGKLPCAVAFRVAEKLGVSTRQVGDAANELDIRMSKCQLGCFP